MKKVIKKDIDQETLPWDIGWPDFNLIEVVTVRPITGCKALEIGYGTGDNSIWLARNHFQMTGTDTSDIALEKAKGKDSEAKVECDFKLVNFFESRVEGAPFGFVFDRGCFHSFRSEDDRRKFAANVAGHLEEGGLWLTLAGNVDEKIKGPGKSSHTAWFFVRCISQ